ncbi:hypothetical protein ACFL4G_00900 [Thermodesulfobacteriota bacterium]
MKSVDKTKSKTLFALVPVFMLLAAVMTSSCGSSPSSDTEIDDPTIYKALFTVSSTYEEDSKDTEKVVASAVFTEVWGILWVEILNGGVNLHGPDGLDVSLDVEHNPFGAPYYEVEFAGDLEEGEFYEFEVVLANGRSITNSIKIPDDELVITEPESNDIIDKGVNLDVEWEGTSNRDALIIISDDEPDLLQLVGHFTPDDGEETLRPDQFFTLFPGAHKFTVVRGNEANVNGFHTNSKIHAFLLYTVPVVIQ